MGRCRQIGRRYVGNRNNDDCGEEEDVDDANDDSEDEDDDRDKDGDGGDSYG